MTTSGRKRSRSAAVWPAGVIVLLGVVVGQAVAQMSAPVSLPTTAPSGSFNPFDPDSGGASQAPVAGQESDDRPPTRPPLRPPPRTPYRP